MVVSFVCLVGAKRAKVSNPVNPDSCW